VRTPGGVVVFARLSVAADLDAPSVIEMAVRDWLASLALEQNLLAGLVTAVREAVLNVCAHAYPPGAGGRVEVVVWTDVRMVHLEVIDHGSWRPPVDNVLGRGMRVMADLDEPALISFDGRGTRILFGHRLACAHGDGASNAGRTGGRTGADALVRG